MTTLDTAVRAWFAQNTWTEVVDPECARAILAELAAAGPGADVGRICFRYTSAAVYRQLTSHDAERREHTLRALLAHLTRRANMVVRDAEYARQLAHETVCAVLARLPALKHPEALLPYCQTAIRRRSWRRQRFERRRQAQEVSIESAYDEQTELPLSERLSETSDSPERAVERSQMNAAISGYIECCATLNNRERSLLRLRFWDDRTPLDIAGHMATTRGSVDSGLSKARAKLANDAAFLALLRSFDYDCCG
jgi:RNA polymerase sigma factor (sigma-70 family)